MKKTSSKAKTTKVTANAFPLDNHLKAVGLTLALFAQKMGLTKDAIEKTNTQTPIVVIGGLLFVRATRYTKNELTAPGNAMSLQSYIKDQHGDSQIAFAKAQGENPSFVTHAVKDGAVWLNDEVYQPISTMGVWPAKRLDVHVDDVCNGNETAFSRVYSTSQQQMHRWLNRDCFFCKGEIFMRRTELSAQSLPATAEAVLLREHIRHEYGPGPDGMQLFAREHNLNPQQIKRYVDYDALWINGDVYKNQSKFEEKGIVPDFSRERIKAA